MPWTTGELERLERAYRSGALEVEYEEQRVKYRSLKDMESLIIQAKQEIEGEEPTWQTPIVPRFIR